MSQSLLILIDLVAVAVLVFALYFPRYRRKDMIVAIVGLNVGVMAVAIALASTEVTAGLGLGLFGVLSIIRLRSTELTQEEVAYYFTALALGLLAGFAIQPVWLTPTLVVAILLGLYLADHPRLFADHRHQSIQLGTAYTNERELVARLELLLDADVMRAKVNKVDLVNDTTSVDVRFRIRQVAEPRGRTAVASSPNTLSEVR